MGYVKEGVKRYRLEVVTALVLFFAAVWLRHTAIHYTADPTLLLAVKLLPILPILLMGAAIWRFYRNCDELQRQDILKTAASASLLSVIVLIAWSMLQAIGLPPMTGQTAVMVICACTAICGLVVNFQGFRADWGVKQAFIRLLPMLVMLVCMLALVLAVNRFLPAQSVPGLRSVVTLGAAIMIMALYWLLKRRVDP